MVTQEAPNSPWVQAGIVSWGIGKRNLHTFKDCTSKNDSKRTS